MKKNNKPAAKRYMKTVGMVMASVMVLSSTTGQMVYAESAKDQKDTQDGEKKEEKTIVYLNGKTGNDKNSGESQDEAVKSFEKAAELLSSGAAEEKNTWTMLPQTVNAMYEPISNSITIPAGILHAPMYDRGASFETNLGGIGTVIAHEVSHALDSMGAKFDEDGNMRNWWNDRDKNAFDGICREVINAYDKIEVLPGRYIDGSKTLGENLADIAGMECILKLAGENNPRLGDIFKNYATIWRMKSDDSYIQMQLENDTHSPDKVRVNRVLSNFGEFERHYKIEKDDIMYLPAEERIRIWR